MLHKILLFLLLFTPFLLSSCKTTKTVIDNNHTLTKIDTVYEKSFYHDSIYLFNDRNVFLKGDTVFVENTKIEYRNKIKLDTICKINFIEKRDSIYIDKTIEVPRKRNLFDWLSYSCLALFVILVIYKITKFIK